MYVQQYNIHKYILYFFKPKYKLKKQILQKKKKTILRNTHTSSSQIIIIIFFFNINDLTLINIHTYCTIQNVQKVWIIIIFNKSNS